MIDLKDIDVTFETKDRTVHAVREVNLRITRGEIYGIVGYSGAGKSTLVRTINLLQRPTSGSVLVKGEELTAMSAKELRETRKNIGMIFQHFNLMESLNVYENVAFPLKRTGISKEEEKGKVENLLELVGLSDRIYNYPSQLSGGQKQRVAIARALATDPDILLCDEATSALDPRTTRSILNLLAELREKLGLTIVLITHEMAVVKDLCDRVAVMEDGYVVESGTILNIFTNPQEQLTRDFINVAIQFEDEIEKVLNHTGLSGLGHLVRLLYVGDNVTEPFIASLVKKFNVESNILHGNIEFIQDTPVGDLLVSLNGEEADIESAIAYFESNNIRVRSMDEIIQRRLEKERV